LKDPDDPLHDAGRRSSASDGGEFSAAMARLEKAVQEIVTVTTGQFSDRAASLLDDTSKRLESELRLHRVTDDDPEVERSQAHRRRRARFRHRLVDRAERVNPRSGRLYRDPKNSKIGGVCAGTARYFGVETWTVRLAALTGMLFVPGIVFPAYWIAYFIMDTPENPETDEPTPRSKKRRRRRREKERESGRPRGAAAVGDEPPQPFVAGRRLRYAGADLTQAELRLRRLESFVTSDQYELQKELAKIEREEDQSNGR
jgi:phage shock protein C